MAETSIAAGGALAQDNTDEARYEARVGERIVGIAEYELTDDQGPIVFTHTEVLPDVEGQGVGTALARAALEDVRRRGLRLVPDCPFISAYLKRQDDWDDLIER